MRNVKIKHVVSPSPKLRINSANLLGWSILIALCVMCCASCTNPGLKTQDYQTLYQDLLYPSVRITTSSGCGSGVIIHHKDTKDTEKSIYVLTAAHVVGNDVLVSVELFNSTESLPAFVVATDTGKDLALLRLITDKPCHYRAKLAPSNYVPYIFTPVWVIGCSLGYPPRPSEGIITVVGGQRTENRRQKTSDICLLASDFWEVSAPIWPGNSGGGVFLKDTHELIGIAVWVRVYHGQLVSTMAGVVTLQNIYEFLEKVASSEQRVAREMTLNPRYSLLATGRR